MSPHKGAEKEACRHGAVHAGLHVSARCIDMPPRYCGLVPGHHNKASKYSNKTSVPSICKKRNICET